jgi:hypothetical protein
MDDVDNRTYAVQLEDAEASLQKYKQANQTTRKRMRKGGDVEHKGALISPFFRAHAH